MPDDITVLSSSTRASVRVEEVGATFKLPKFNKRCLYLDEIPVSSPAQETE
jgi:hypothetical protein